MPFPASNLKTFVSCFVRMPVGCMLLFKSSGKIPQPRNSTMRMWIMTSLMKSQDKILYEMAALLASDNTNFLRCIKSFS